MTSTTPTLEVRGVARTYGSGRTSVAALADVSFSVQPRELVAIMGPSGSGKSTLLAIAGGLDRATEGHVLVDGSDLGELDARALAQLRRRTIGYVFQELNLLGTLTAEENVALPLELDGTRPTTAASQHGRCSASSAWPSCRPGSPTSCPAASSNASRSPVPWWASVACCWQTSRPARLTP